MRLPWHLPGYLRAAARKTIEVNGTVSYKGERLKSGEVRFFSGADSRTVLINPDGTYSIGNCAAGEAKVAIVSTKADFPEAKIGKRGVGLTVPASVIPEKYGDPETSNLLYTLKNPAGQKIDIDLTD